MIFPKSSAAPTKKNSGAKFQELKRFDFENVQNFFGRDKEADEVFERLKKKESEGMPVLVVSGMSGVGKSTLVGAGVMPRLAGDRPNEWRAVALRPSYMSTDIVKALSEAILRVLGGSDLEAEGLPPIDLSPEQLSALLRGKFEDGIAIVRDYLSGFIAVRPDTHRAVLVDQLEEIFTLPQVTAEDREVFVKTILELAKQHFGIFVMTLRSDFLRRAKDVPQLAGLLEGDSHYRLEPPTRAHLIEIVEGYLQGDDRSGEMDAAASMLKELVLKAVDSRLPALPFLRFTISEMFDPKSVPLELRNPAGEDLLRIGSFKSMGGVRGVVAKRAAEIYQALDPDVRNALDGVMRRLVRVDRRGIEVLDFQPFEKVVTNAQERKLIESFVEEGFVAADRGDEDRPVLQLVHEGLIGFWWEQIEAQHRGAAKDTRNLLESMYLQWEKSGRKPFYLIPQGGFLRDARGFLSRNAGRLSPQLEEFVTTSVNTPPDAKEVVEIPEKAALSPAPVGTVKQMKTARVELPGTNTARIRREVHRRPAEAAASKGITDEPLSEPKSSKLEGLIGAGLAIAALIIGIWLGLYFMGDSNPKPPVLPQNQPANFPAPKQPKEVPTSAISPAPIKLPLESEDPIEEREVSSEVPE